MLVASDYERGLGQMMNGATLFPSNMALTATGAGSLQGELSIVFLNDSEMAELHGRFLRDPTTTDVITFPGDAKEDFAGDSDAWKTHENENRSSDYW